jgi:hypothetical protein
VGWWHPASRLACVDPQALKLRGQVCTHACWYQPVSHAMPCHDGTCYAQLWQLQPPRRKWGLCGLLGNVFYAAAHVLQQQCLMSGGINGADHSSSYRQDPQAWVVCCLGGGGGGALL